MKFETVLFAAAFIALAAISIPEDNENAETDASAASAYTISFPEPAAGDAADALETEDGEDVLAQRSGQSS